MPLGSSAGDLTKLRRELGVAGLEESDERAVAERSADRLHFREFVTAPEDVEEAGRLSSRASET